MNEVKPGESCIPDFGYGPTEAGHLWSEHKNDQASALYLDADFEKAFKIDDISSVFHYDLIPDIGGLSSYMTGERKGELRCTDFGGMLNEDKIVNLHQPVTLSNASKDYILDEVPELDYQFCEEWSFRDASSELHSPATRSEVVRVCEPSIPVPECFNNQVGKSTSGVMHDFSESKCGFEALAEDEIALKCSLACDLQDVHEAKNIQSLLEIDRSLVHGIKKTNFSSGAANASCTSTSVQYEKVCSVSEDMQTDELLMNELSTGSSAEAKMAISRRRRLSKPPQRYIEGSPWSKSRVHRARKCSSSSSNDKGPRVQFQKKHHSTASEGKALKVIESNSYSSFVQELDSDEEYDPLPSHFNIGNPKRKSDRKKSNKTWTLTEVSKLVDGIAHFGLGQWTAIKRNFFPSSYRTSTDIRDKWRNLVKTNCRDLKSRREHHRSSAQPLPAAVLERVRELVIAHQNPRY